ncbi:hypothetical protein DMENIID0001_096750 [Sergentomyia squamirostris]
MMLGAFSQYPTLAHTPMWDPQTVDGFGGFDIPLSVADGPGCYQKYTQSFKALKLTPWSTGGPEGAARSARSARSVT